MGKSKHKQSRIQKDLEIADRIRERLSIDVSAPMAVDTRVSSLVASGLGTIGGAIGRFMPLIPKVAVIAPTSATASDHHETTVRESVVAKQSDVEFRVGSPNRQSASSKMRHHRVR